MCRRCVEVCLRDFEYIVCKKKETKINFDKPTGKTKTDGEMQMTPGLPDNVCRQLWQNKEHRLSRHCAREETQLDSCRPIANGWPLPAALMQSSRISSEVVDQCAGLTNIRQTPTSSPLMKWSMCPQSTWTLRYRACAAGINICKCDTHPGNPVNS